MEPELESIKLDMVTEHSSIVEISYIGSTHLKGIELMGVDAGLSWLKGKSISLKSKPASEGYKYYFAFLEVVESCEFRARGFDNETDHWEAGLANHRIDRLEDGTITLKTELASDQYYFNGSLPIDYEPSLEVAIHRIEHLDETNPSLYQILVDLTYWINGLYEQPLSGEKVYPLPTIIRHLKIKGREIDSKKVDEVVRPVIVSLYDMYKSALDFAEEDERLLNGSWEKEGHISRILELKEKVRKLDSDPKIGIGVDSFDRFKILLNFVS